MTCRVMPDRIPTEEVERIANRNDCLAAVTALRALAAERDALREDLRWIENVAGEPSEPHYGQALSAVRDRAHFALGEYQP